MARPTAIVALFTLVACIAPEPAATPGALEDVRRVVAALDDVAGDYHLAVADGQVVGAPVFRTLNALMHDAGVYAQRFPEAERQRLRAVAEAVATRQPAARVEAKAQHLRGELLASHGVTLAPGAPPDPARARQLWRALCVACHGTRGFGDGLQGLGLQPEPKSFQDPDFMATLAPSRAYSRITEGVRETAMPAWGMFSASELWGLSFLVFTLRHDEAAAARGELVFRRLDRPWLASQTELADRTDGELLARLRGLGLAPDEARDALAFLRQSAFVLPRGAHAEARRSLGETVALYTERRWAAALAEAERARGQLLAVAETVELADPILAARLEDRTLALMAALAGSAIDSEVDRRATALQVLLDRAEPGARATTSRRVALQLALAAGLAVLALGLACARVRTWSCALLIALVAWPTLAHAEAALRLPSPAVAWLGTAGGLVLLVLLGEAARRAAAAFPALHHLAPFAVALALAAAVGRLTWMAVLHGHLAAVPAHIPRIEALGLFPDRSALIALLATFAGALVVQRVVRAMHESASDKPWSRP